MFKVVALLILPALLSSCHTSGRGNVDKGGERRLVTVSIPPLAYFVKSVAGDSVEVNTLIPPSADAETFQPGIETMKRLAGSDILFTTGMMEMEEKAAKSVTQSGSGIVVCRLSDNIEPVYGTHNHAHQHEGDARQADPHIWSSIKNGRIISHNVLKSLQSRYPELREYFQGRYERIDTILARADTKALSCLNPGTAFLIWHPALSYMARDYSLVQVPVNMENKENSAMAMAGVFRRSESLHPSAFFVPKGLKTSTVTTIADEMGLIVTEVDFMSEQWLEQMMQVVDALGNKQ